MPYLAPEILTLGRDAVSTKSDIWAVGCIGYEMGVGRSLSENGQYINRHIVEGTMSRLTIPDFPEGLGPEARYVIENCLRWDSNQRCSAENLHSYIQGLKDTASPIKETYLLDIDRESSCRVH
jgi:serine/threonine protein kinase